MDAATASPAEQVLFFLFAGLTIGLAIFTMTRRNPVAAVVSLVGSFLSLAAIYATLSAHFVTILQVAVYAGAIMVLFIFVVMILNREEISPVSFRGIITRVVFGLGAVLYLVFVAASIVAHFARTQAIAAAASLPESFGTVKSLGRLLFSDFVFPFEAISVLLLVAIAGGVVVSRSAKQEQEAEEVARREAAVRSMIRVETRVGGSPQLTAGGDVAHGTSVAHGHGGH